MEHKTETLESYIYNLDEHKLLSDSYCLISGIGSEYRTANSRYYTDCMNVPRNECTFQYTISGEGAVVIKKKVHRLHAGQAFLVEKPGHFRYYLPKGSDHWRFKWISMNVPSIFYWRDITDNYGRIIELGENSRAMNYWESIYEHAQRNEINDVFLSSAYAYTFIMHLHQDLNASSPSEVNTDAFQYCLRNIHRRYTDPLLSLKSIAEELHTSPSYLSRLFKKHMQESYVQHLTRHRMSIAEELLTSTNLSIEAIASKVGLQDANYFSRVFRKQNGLSPSQYRLENSNVSVVAAVEAEPVIRTETNDQPTP